MTRIELTGDKTVTIDLKGHTITDTGADAFHVKTGTLIVIDSIGGGKIIHTGNDDLVWLQDGGTLQINAGFYSFATEYGIAYGGDNLIINGGSYQLDASCEEKFKEYVAEGKTVTINGVIYTKE